MRSEPYTMVLREYRRHSGRLKMPGHVRRLIAKRAFAAALMLSAAQTAAHSQRVGRITGTVSDAITGEPVGDVAVAVLGSSVAAGTDSAGHYSIDGVVPGLVRLKAQLLGYLPITTDYYSVLPDTSVQVDFKLAPVAYEMDAVEVTAENPVRRWRHEQSARLVTHEQLPRRGNVLDALQGVVSGVRVSGDHENTRLVVRGQTADVLYVLDGTALRPPLTFYIDAADVDCVEIRKGFSAVMEFKPPGNEDTHAGVVLIFTKGYLGNRPRGCTPDKP
jgi:hypothetical protein